MFPSVSSAAAKRQARRGGIIGRLGLRHTLAGGIIIGAVCRSGCILLGLQGVIQGSLGLVQLVLGIRKGLSVLLCLFSSLSGFVRHGAVSRAGFSGNVCSLPSPSSRRRAWP